MPIKIQRKMRVLVIAAAMTFVSASFYGRRVGVFASTEYEAAEAANTAACARAECVTELSSRRILYEKNGEDRLPMASTTKIATALTVLEGGNDLDEIFKVPAASRNRRIFRLSERRRRNKRKRSALRTDASIGKRLRRNAGAAGGGKRKEICRKNEPHGTARGRTAYAF